MTSPILVRPQSMGMAAEEKVACLFRRFGYQVQRELYRNEYDLLLNGSIRIEVKCAQPQFTPNGPKWKFNIQRHGRVSEEGVDLYVLRLEEIPYFKDSLYLLFEAPIRRQVITISFLSLLTRYADNARAFRIFCRRGKIKEIT